MNFKPYSSSLLVFGGFLLVAMGIYFGFMRPPLLPEDSLYMRTTVSTIENNVPGISAWLQKVFWVMGSYIFTTGLLTVLSPLPLFEHVCLALLLSLPWQESLQ